MKRLPRFVKKVGKREEMSPQGGGYPQVWDWVYKTEHESGDWCWYTHENGKYGAWFHRDWV
jgi:hypothetical protein